MFTIVVKKHVDRIFKKLSKKNRKQLETITKKLQEILKNPYRFKSLHFPFTTKRRVHIDKSFVLVYSIDEKNKFIIIEDYDHHDKIYKK